MKGKRLGKVSGEKCLGKSVGLTSDRGRGRNGKLNIRFKIKLGSKSRLVWKLK